MTKQEKLISLLQPKEYKSKIKLFCREKRLETEKITLEKVALLKDNDYIRAVIIKPIEK